MSDLARLARLLGSQVEARNYEPSFSASCLRNSSVESLGFGAGRVAAGVSLPSATPSARSIRRIASTRSVLSRTPAASRAPERLPPKATWPPDRLHPVEAAVFSRCSLQPAGNALPMLLQPQPAISSLLNPFSLHRLESDRDIQTSHRHWLRSFLYPPKKTLIHKLGAPSFPFLATAHLLLQNGRIELAVGNPVQKMLRVPFCRRDRGSV